MSDDDSRPVVRGCAWAIGSLVAAVVGGYLGARIGGWIARGDGAGFGVMSGAVIGFTGTFVALVFLAVVRKRK